MTVLAIDPGNEFSAYVLLDGDCVIDRGKCDNAELLASLHDDVAFADAKHLAVEMIASYGMPVGREVFDTCVWIGRFIEAWQVARGLPSSRVYRKDVKLHLCGQARAKDGNIRQALIDRWGGKEKAIGKKHSPGPLYGVSADVWAALAVAVTWSDATRIRSAA